MKHILVNLNVRQALDGTLIKKLTAYVLLVVMATSFSGALTTQAYAPTGSTSAEPLVILNAEQVEVLRDFAEDLNLLAQQKGEVLWLARVIYSESKRPHEQALVAWVVRNRTENKFYSDGTYEGTALARSQFSGMHPRLDRHATRNLSMNYQTVGDPAWESAMRIAEEVYYSDGSNRPFDGDVQHFYSPIVIAPPAWAYHGEKVYETEGRRFAFYRGIN